MTGEENPAVHMVEDENFRQLCHTVRGHLSEFENRVWWQYVTGVSVSDIARGLGRDERSVHNAIYRIRKKLRERLEQIAALEAELKEKEKDLKAKETAKKSVLLRLPPSLHNQIAAWAEEDFRSINGQIEFLLSQAVSEKYKKK